MANGKNCELQKGKDKGIKLTEYLKDLKDKTGYKSLKEKYYEMTTKMYNTMKSTHTEPEDMDKFVTKQINAAALAGPFVVNPFSSNSNICISPLMTVPKKPNGRRIVLDASFGEGPNTGTPER